MKKVQQNGKSKSLITLQILIGNEKRNYKVSELMGVKHNYRAGNL